MKAQPLIQSEVFWRPVVVSANSSIRDSLLDVLRLRIPLSELSTLSEYPDVHTILELVAANNSNVCFIDVGTGENRALPLIRELTAHNLTVVALHTGKDPELILRCVRSGVHDFLSAPFEADSVWATLGELATRRLKSEPEPRGSVYVVVPSKPNLGSTTVAVGLATRAQRGGCKSVLLADLDPLYGSIGFQLKIKGPHTFLDAFSMWERVDEDLWSQLVVSYSGLDVLMAPEATGTSGFVCPRVADFLEFVRKRYSIAFLDCPGLLTDWYTQLASEADGVFLVTTNEVMAIHATKRCLEMLERCSFGAEKVRLVVNRYHPQIGIARDAIEAALGRPVFHTLANDYEAVQKAIFEGKPIGSGSQVGKGLDELWTRVIGKKATPKAHRPWSSLFSMART